MYDYIIIGAGSAGCVLANRLSAGDAKVLLLEAGGKDSNFFIHMPAGYGVILMKGMLDWGYITEASPAVNGRQIPYARGKVLGGSSSVNGMTHIRGAASDFDKWRDAGNPGWGYEDCLPYFKKSERREGGGPHRGTDGPIYVYPEKVRQPFAKAFIEAAQQAGYPYNPDFNSGQLEGVGPPDFTIRDGKRVSEATAYLHPVMARPNLEVLTNAHATRIIIENNRAVGVDYLQNGQPGSARASTEVILSAGTINSPQLLMLSGIGDSDALRAAGVSPVHHLPGVGRNLQDHGYCTARWESLKPVSLYPNYAGPKAILNLLEYVLLRRGLNARMGTEAVAFLKSDPALADPDLQFYLISMLYAEGRPGIAKQHGFMAVYHPSRPVSRGYVALKSADPLAAPIVQPNFLADESDIVLLRKGLARAREIVEQKAFDEFRGKELAPGPAAVSDADIDAYHRATSGTAWHPVGTCRMGRGAGDVVDAQLKVHGIDGLRVVDASVMPAIVSANTNTAVVMIAERAADFILSPAVALPEYAEA